MNDIEIIANKTKEIIKETRKSVKNISPKELRNSTKGGILYELDNFKKISGLDVFEKKYSSKEQKNREDYKSEDFIKAKSKIWFKINDDLENLEKKFSNEKSKTSPYEKGRVKGLKKLKKEIKKLFENYLYKEDIIKAIRGEWYDPNKIKEQDYLEIQYRYILELPENNENWRTILTQIIHDICDKN